MDDWEAAGGQGADAQLLKDQLAILIDLPRVGADDLGDFDGLAPGAGGVAQARDEPLQEAGPLGSVELALKVNDVGVDSAVIALVEDGDAAARLDDLDADVVRGDQGAVGVAHRGGGAEGSAEPGLIDAKGKVHVAEDVPE